MVSFLKTIGPYFINKHFSFKKRLPAYRFCRVERTSHISYIPIIDPTIPVLITSLVLFPRAIEWFALSRAEHLIEKLLCQVTVQMIRSICESKIPPTRPARMTYAEVVGLVDILQFSNVFLSQIDNLEVLDDTLGRDRLRHDIHVGCVDLE